MYRQKFTPSYSAVPQSYHGWAARYTQDGEETVGAPRSSPCSSPPCSAVSDSDSDSFPDSRPHKRPVPEESLPCAGKPEDCACNKKNDHGFFFGLFSGKDDGTTVLLCCAAALLLLCPKKENGSGVPFDVLLPLLFVFLK